MQTKRPSPTLTDGPVRLRALCADDVQARFDLGNTPEIIRMFGGAPDAVQPITMAQAEEWVNEESRQPRPWVIDYRERMIGSAYLHSIDRRDRRATVAMGILDPNLLGQGIGPRVMHLIAAYAFNTVKLHRLALRVLHFNTRAIAAYKKVGFVVEGRERESALIGNEWHDDVIMGLLQSDYAKARAA